MRKITILFIMFLFAAQIGQCALLNKEVNIFNVKENNMYILDLDSSVKNLNISDKDIVNLTPVTLISGEKRQIFVETGKMGVCDVVLTTDSDIYQIRFISGPIFESTHSELIQVDMPMRYSAE